MSNVKPILAAALLTALSASAAQAALVGAYTIEITNAGGDYLQVGEVVATQLGTGNDVALATAGATASATSVYSATSGPEFAIDGLFPAGYVGPGYPGPYGIYHSAGGSDTLTISLAHPFNLTSLTIYGRTDCCSTRDNYNVEILNKQGNTIFSGNLNNSSLSGLGGTITFGASAVPEASTWVMMLAGLGALGFLSARKSLSKAAA